jgi:type IV secretory pathway protease TraF
MTKKDYVKFAKMIAEQQAGINNIKLAKSDKSDMYKFGLQSMLNSIKSELIIMFQSDNPSFDSVRFNQFIDSQVKSIIDSVQ